MKIVFLSTKDYAGASYNFCSAINKYTRHEAENIVAALTQYDYPYSYLFSATNAEKLRHKIYASDVIVFVEQVGVDTKMGLDITKLKNKKIALTYGGWGFRNPDARKSSSGWYNRINGELTKISTSADFLETEKLPWVPRCVRTEEIREKHDYLKVEPPMIAISPAKGSDRLRGTSANFNRIMIALRQKNYKFQDLVISNSRSIVDNDTCLTRKAPASIFFDRLYPIYGMNSLEAGALESAVVTGTPDHALNVIKEHTGFECPFIIVPNWEQTQKTFEELLQDPAYMRKKGLACYDYTKKIEKYAAKRLIEILGD